MNIRINNAVGPSQGLTCEQAKQKDLVDYLATLGYNPSKIKGNDYWYLSPLRQEKTASFKINRKLNVWFDHGTGKGGTLVDFGILYHNCTVRELLEKLRGNHSFHRPSIKMIVPEKSPIQIISEKNLISLSLLRYIRQRHISDEVAKKYCGEVSFSLHDKTYSAVSFKNNKGGFELRNQWFKGSSSPKAITTIGNGSKKLAVFEGFFDFLSYKSIQQNQTSSEVNFLVLNSTSFFEKSRLYMESHDQILLFLDRDKTGQKFTEMALSWNKKYTNESHLYQGSNDLNEWLQQRSKSMKKGFSQ
ncbi:MAG: toprim domain-containing protein [Ginsengibacter sp.]